MTMTATSKWPEVKLGDYVDLLAGYAFKSKDFTDNLNDVPLVKGANVHQGYIDWADSKYWPRSEFGKHQKFLLNEGDVVIAMDRPWIESGLKYSWIKQGDPQSLLVQRVSRLRGSNGLRTDYVRYLIGSIDFTNYIKPIVTGVTVPHISPSQIKDFRFRLPPLETQRKIASILSAYDDLIENNGRRIKILEEMARMIYREWFVNFRFPGHEQVKLVDSQLGMIPEGWEVKVLADVYSTGSGGTPSRTHEEYYGGEIPWIKTRELNDGFILAADEMITELGLKKSSARLFPTNTVVIAMYGATIGKLGILTYAAATNQACCALLPQNNTFGYAYLYFTLLNRRADLIALGQGAAQQNISQAVIKGFELLVPDGSVVTTFNRAVEPMLGQIKTISLKNQNLRQTHDLLLPKLISGEVAVLRNVEAHCNASLQGDDKL